MTFNPLSWFLLTQVVYLCRDGKHLSSYIIPTFGNIGILRSRSPSFLANYGTRDSIVSAPMGLDRVQPPNTF